ncbi:hypothetical protein [Streptosporangium longisporum]|uniref:Uncharacterized protein n=1 Tax=Streptosporangium longisporum TaxID=46187 RepID=A0ABP6L486_9ACTN
MSVRTALPAGLALHFDRPEMAPLAEQAERLFEKVPLATVTAFVVQGMEAAKRAGTSGSWALELAAEANRLLAADPDELEELI